ncbi:AGC/MAST/MAST protein kinase, variant [Capsaspora owczarzaki ATCC 30864]|uniref:non-specific serine/threonine protein kinase n=1 Tax=Capsaspora owczarzaki (strain ATCC 30864) TaxID=595528 RepID=A0A0D2WI61_CAPO3|nr:AGC/MAST/MAST protein kinase, variant [Capsaspora owczarzaki ATCC 30864]
MQDDAGRPGAPHQQQQQQQQQQEAPASSSFSTSSLSSKAVIASAAAAATARPTPAASLAPLAAAAAAPALETVVAAPSSLSSGLADESGTQVAGLAINTHSDDARPALMTRPTTSMSVDAATVSDVHGAGSTSTSTSTSSASPSRPGKRHAPLSVISSNANANADNNDAADDDVSASARATGSSAQVAGPSPHQPQQHQPSQQAVERGHQPATEADQCSPSERPQQSQFVASTAIPTLTPSANTTTTTTTTTTNNSSAITSTSNPSTGSSSSSSSSSSGERSPVRRRGIKPRSNTYSGNPISFFDGATASASAAAAASATPSVAAAAHAVTDIDTVPLSPQVMGSPRMESQHAAAAAAAAASYAHQRELLLRPLESMELMTPAAAAGTSANIPPGAVAAAAAAAAAAPAVVTAAAAASTPAATSSTQFVDQIVRQYHPGANDSPPISGLNNGMLTAFSGGNGSILSLTSSSSSQTPTNYASPVATAKQLPSLSSPTMRSVSPTSRFSSKRISLPTMPTISTEQPAPSSSFDQHQTTPAQQPPSSAPRSLHSASASSQSLQLPGSYANSNLSFSSASLSSMSSASTGSINSLFSEMDGPASSQYHQSLDPVPESETPAPPRFGATLFASDRMSPSGGNMSPAPSPAFSDEERSWRRKQLLGRSEPSLPSLQLDAPPKASTRPSSSSNTGVGAGLRGASAPGFASPSPRSAVEVESSLSFFPFDGLTPGAAIRPAAKGAPAMGGVTSGISASNSNLSTLGRRSMPGHGRQASITSISSDSPPRRSSGDSGSSAALDEEEGGSFRGRSHSIENRRRLRRPSEGEDTELGSPRARSLSPVRRLDVDAGLSLFGTTFPKVKLHLEKQLGQFIVTTEHRSQALAQTMEESASPALSRSGSLSNLSPYGPSPLTRSATAAGTVTAPSAIGTAVPPLTSSTLINNLLGMTGRATPPPPASAPATTQSVPMIGVVAGSPVSAGTPTGSTSRSELNVFVPATSPLAYSSASQQPLVSPRLALGRSSRDDSSRPESPLPTTSSSQIHHFHDGTSPIASTGSIPALADNSTASLNSPVTLRRRSITPTATRRMSVEDRRSETRLLQCLTAFATDLLAISTENRLNGYVLRPFLSKLHGFLESIAGRFPLVLRSARELLYICSRPARLIECLEFDPEAYYRSLASPEQARRTIDLEAFDPAKYVSSRMMLRLERFGTQIAALEQMPDYATGRYSKEIDTLEQQRDAMMARLNILRSQSGLNMRENPLARRFPLGDNPLAGVRPPSPSRGLATNIEQHSASFKPHLRSSAAASLGQGYSNEPAPASFLFRQSESILQFAKSGLLAGLQEEGSLGEGEDESTPFSSATSSRSSIANTTAAQAATATFAASRSNSFKLSAAVSDFSSAAPSEIPLGRRLLPPRVPRKSDFDYLKLISKGAYGSVLLARHKETHELFAIKALKKREMILRNQVENVLAERDILAVANNPFVVSMFASFQSKNHLYLVMEFVQGGDCATLLKALGAFSEEMARTYVSETVLAVEYLHTNGIIHRDLKPDNLLLTENGHIKLTDFGLSQIGLVNRTATLYERSLSMERGHSRQTSEGANMSFDSSFSSDMAETALPPHVPASGGATTTTGSSAHAQSQHRAAPCVGTPDYMAPEIILGSAIGPEVDWWALGVMTFEFLTGVPPFRGNSVEELFRDTLKAEIDADELSECSPAAQEFISRLLAYNPTDRLGHNGADEVKSTAFFELLDWDSLLMQRVEFVPVLDSEDDTKYFDSTVLDFSFVVASPPLLNVHGDRRFACIQCVCSIWFC